MASIGMSCGYGYLNENKNEIKPIPLEKIDFSAIHDFDQGIGELPDT